MADLISLQNLQRWGVKGGLSILDQGFFSGANFIASILFARWLSPDDYGAYAIAFALYLLFTGFYIAFILEPMSVLGPAKYLTELANYMLVQIKLHVGITAALLLVTMLIGWLLIVFDNTSLGNAFLGMGAAVPCMLFLWYVRRMFYVMQQPLRAFLASLLYFLLLVVGATVLHSNHFLNSFTVFILLGATSLLTSLFSLWLKLDLLHRGKGTGRIWTEYGKEQWLYGRWIAGAAMLAFLANQIQVIMLAGLINLQSAGALDALQNFIAPVMQAITAISTLVLPMVSYDFGQSNITSLRRKIVAVTLILLLVAGTYEIILFIFPEQLELSLYSGKYSDFSHLIPVLGVIPIFTAVTTGFSLALRAIQKPQFYLLYGMIVAPVGLLTGILFTRFWGMEGAVSSLVITSFVTLVVHMCLYRNWFLLGTVKLNMDQADSR